MERNSNAMVASLWKGKGWAVPTQVVLVVLFILNLDRDRRAPGTVAWAC